MNHSSPASRPRVLVVIVNYRTGELVCDCLDSLVEEVKANPGLQIEVVDNDSGDDSPVAIANHIEAEGYTQWAKLNRAERNGGFAYGNNVAIRPALEKESPPDFILLLNPDTVIHPGAVSELVKYLDKNEKIGVAGSRLEDTDGSPQHSAFRFPNFFSEVEEGARFCLVTKLLKRWVVAPAITEQVGETPWVSGASMMVRREVFDAIGLLDEAYFMYYEELDFIKRAADAGWRCAYVPQSRVVHLVGQASGVTDIKQPLKRRPAYWFVSRSRYFRLHHGRLGKFIIDLGWLNARLFFKAMNAVRRKTINDPPHLVRDFLRHNLLPGQAKS